MSFDQAVRDCIEQFLGYSFSNPEWSLAGLSSKMGGLGLRSAELHSPAAFIASQLACKDLCGKLDPSHAWDPLNQGSNCFAALTVFNSRVCPENVLDLNADTFPRQQTLSQSIDNKVLLSILSDNANNVHFRAHINHTTTSGAGAWLNAVPSRALGTHIDSQLYVTMIKRWLRVPLLDKEIHCPYCDDMVDMFGDHCLTCGCGGDRTKRHNLLRNEVFHQCVSSGLNPELERPGLLQPRPIIGSFHDSGAARDQNANRRPADVYLPKWRNGAPAALDLAVTSGQRRDIVNRSAEDGSIATKLYEDTKRLYLSTEAKCQEEGITFIPMVCEADGGGWGPAAQGVLSILAKNKSILTGEDSSLIATRILQSLGLILHRENARSIIRRFTRRASLDCSELLAASVTCSLPLVSLPPD